MQNMSLVPVHSKATQIGMKCPNLAVKSELLYSNNESICYR